MGGGRKRRQLQGRVVVGQGGNITTTLEVGPGNDCKLPVDQDFVARKLPVN